VSELICCCTECLVGFVDVETEVFPSCLTGCITKGCQNRALCVGPMDCCEGDLCNSATPTGLRVFFVVVVGVVEYSENQWALDLEYSESFVTVFCISAQHLDWAATHVTSTMTSAYSAQLVPPLPTVVSPLKWKVRFSSTPEVFGSNAEHFKDIIYHRRAELKCCCTGCLVVSVIVENEVFTILSYRSLH